MSEDAHEIAQRIVREVLEAHAAEASHSGASTVAADDARQQGDTVLDLRELPAAVAADASAAVLDDSTARLTARRIVEEVLASHAQAERDASEDLPVLAEGEAAGPPSATPVLHPITGRPAVLPSLPDEPDLDADTDVADDAAAIARRIVASVLSQRPAATDDGPPPLPARLQEPDAGAEPEPAPEPVVAHGSYRLAAPETHDEPAPTDVQTTAQTDPEATPDPTPEPMPGTTALLSPEEPTDPDATTRLPVATLQRPVVDEVRIEPTLSLPSSEPPRRTGRWLLASILGAVALAVLLPLAVQALRTLVSLS